MVFERATTKKGRQLFWEKVHPRQNPGYAYEYVFMHNWCNSRIFSPHTEQICLLL